MNGPTEKYTRRDFMVRAAAISGLGVLPAAHGTLLGQNQKPKKPTKPWFKISLAQWSLHRTLSSNKLDNLDFAKSARDDFGIGAIEYVNSFFKSKAQDKKYLGEMKKRAADHGVKSLLIMVDGEGRLGDPDASARAKAIDNHIRWLDAAKFLGCHAIRVNAASAGEYEEQLALAADGLRRLAEKGAERGLNVIVENHGGLSSNGAWLAAVMKRVAHKRCGTLPDFGNFRVSKEQMYDRYKGVTELMPYAKAVSAKSHDFDAEGNEVHTDYVKMLRIVKKADYRGFIGIEYEGGKLSEAEGIRATKKLLERVRG